MAQLLLIGRGKQKLAREISSVLQYTTQFINLNNLVWQFHILQALRQLESEELNIVFVWQSNAHNRQNHIKWKFINHNQFFLLYSISLCQIGWFEYSSRKKNVQQHNNFYVIEYQFYIQDQIVAYIMKLPKTPYPIDFSNSLCSVARWLFLVTINLSDFVCIRAQKIHYFRNNNRKKTLYTH